MAIGLSGLALPGASRPPGSSKFTRAFLALDNFREVPADLTEPTLLGSFFTVLAYIICATLFVCELSAFLSTQTRTTIVMDANQDKQLRINFDLVMHDLQCKYLSVGVWDSFGSERLNITTNLNKRKVDHLGKFHEYTEEELLSLDKMNYTDAEMEEYNRDWSSSSEKHTSFDEVVESHDFTFINFYAGWCHHCKHFAPEWDKFEKELNVNNTLTDAKGNSVVFRVIKLNCVDFEDTCRNENVQGFPTVRLYSRSLGKKRKYVSYNSARTTESLVKFATEQVKQLTVATANPKFHDFFREGCRVEGFAEVSRVPGTLHFEAVHSRDDSLNLAFTNVSHTVNHLSFSTAGDNAKYPSRGVPESFAKNVGVLNGKSFTTMGFHQAPHHYIQVVSTYFESQNARSYQLTHQQRISTVPKHSIPQAKFSFSLAPVEVRVEQVGKRWYEFFTSIFAIVGGAFTFVGMTQGTTVTAKQMLKTQLNKVV